jgi:TolB protein
MKCSITLQNRLLAGLLALVMAAPPGAGAFYRYPTSDDFLSPPDRTCSSPAPSPDGRSVAYVVEDSGLKQLWLRTQGKPPSDRKLSDGQANDDSPDWSPDGTKLYFASDRGGASKIWVLEIAAGTRRPVTTGGGQDFHPRVSRSGRRLAFDSNRSGNYDVWVRDLDRREDRQLTDSTAGDFSPCWSPDEAQLAFTSSRGGSFNIWLQDVSGKTPARRLTAGSGGSAHPDWSPDGRAIAYDSDRGGATKVFVQPVRGSAEPLAVTDLLSNEERPRYTRDGKRIFFGARENQLAGFKARPAPDVAAPPPVPRPAAVSASGPLEPSLGSPASRAAPSSLYPGAPPLDPLAPSEAGNNQFRGNRGKTGGIAVLQFFPGSQPGGIALNSPLGAVFNVPLDRRQDLKSQVRLWEATSTAGFEISYNPVLRRLDILPDLPLRSGCTYRVALARTLRAESGATLGEPFAWNFVTAPKLVRRDPVVQVGRLNSTFAIGQTHPRARAGGVDPATRVRVDFTFPLDPRSLDVNSLRLLSEAGEPVPGELYFPPGDSTLQLTPYERLEPGSVYEVRLSEKLRSQDGEPMKGTRSWRFRTAFTGPLKIVAVEPKGPLGEHPVIRLTFNRPVSRKSVGAGKVSLQGKNFPYPGGVMLGDGNKVLTFEPYQKLPDRESYKLFLPVDLVDADGNGLEMQGPLTFTTNHQAAERATAAAAALPPARKAGAPQAVAAKGGPAPRQPKGAKQAKPGLIEMYLGAPSEPDGAATRAPAGSPLANFERGQAKQHSASDRADTWMVRDLGSLAERGHLSREFTGDLERHGGSLSRYKTAMYVQEAMKALPYMKPPEKEKVRQLACSLDRELASLGVQVAPAIASSPATQPRRQAPTDDGLGRTD